MASIDVESLLREVSADAPAGPNLEYDPAYLELMRIAQGTPEQQMGAVIVPAQEPDWKIVRNKSQELLARTKDLAVATKLVESSLRVDGFAGLRDSLAVLLGTIRKFWETLHPQLDPADNNDPLARLNLLAALCDPDTMIRRVQEVPLANSANLGRFSYRDIEQAMGKIPTSAGATAPKADVIDAAFKETSPEDLKNISAAVADSLESLKTIDNVVTEKVGQGRGPNLAEIVRVLREVKSQLDQRLGGAAPVEGVVAGGVTASGGGRAISGEISSSADVVAWLDKICDYFARYEPSSPVPLLLRRAKRLVSKDFVALIRDLTPEALDKLGIITGTEPESKEK